MARVALERPSRPAISVASIVALLRRLRGDLQLVATVVGVVIVTSFVFAAIPRLFNQMSDDGLRYAIDGARPFLRNIQMSRAMRIPAGSDGGIFAQVDGEGQEFQESLTPAIQSVIDHRTFVVDSPRYIFTDAPGQPVFPFPRYFTFEYPQGIEPHITLTDGRWPAPTSEVVAVPFDLDQTEAPVFELAISSEAARQLNVKIGDRVWLKPDTTDTLVRRVPARNLKYVVAEITGFIELTDVSDAFWFADPRLDRAVEYDDGNTVHIYATALMSPDAYPSLLTATDPAPIGYRWRYFTDTNAFDAGTLPALAADVRRLDAEYPSTGLSSPTETSVRTGLSRIFHDFLAQRSLSEAILSLASIGLLAVALAVIGLVAAMIAERRRDQTALIRGRGGSSRQILFAQAVEGLLLSIPAAIVGFLLAAVIIDARANTLSPLAALGIALATSVLLVLALSPYVRRPLRAVEREDVVVAHPSARRVAFEALVVVLAIVGVYLLRRRGLSADTAAQDIGGFDAYLAAVPVLLGLATGVLVLRIYPLPIRLMAWAAALRRDLVLSLGFRRVARQPSITSAPLLVLLLSVAVGVFSSVMLYTIDEGQIRTSWQTVGADYRVDAFPGTSLYRSVDMSIVDGVEAIAPAYVQQGVSLVSTTPVFGLVSLMAIDTRAYAEVTAGTPVEARFPAALLNDPQGADLGTPSNPISVVASRHWVANRDLSPGDTFTINLSRLEVSFIVRQVRDSFATFDEGDSWIVAPLGAIQSMNPRSPLRPTRLFLRAPDSAEGDIRTTLAGQSAGATLTSRPDVYGDVHDSPLISGAVSGFRIGILIAAAYSALAVAVSLALTARSRARDLAYLRTLGLSDQQVLGLIIVEQAPPVVLALGVGIALGIATTHLIEPGIDLTAFTGPGVSVPIRIDTAGIVVLTVGLIVVVAAAIAAMSAAARRADLGSTLRLGDD